MKIWLNGRRRELRLTGLGEALALLLVALSLGSIDVLPALTGHQHLNVWFWISLVTVLWLLFTSCSSIGRLLRSNAGLRLFTAVVIADPADGQSKR